MKHVVIYILSIIYLTSPITAKAQQIVRLSTSEDIALLFYKSGKVVPNFTRWVEANSEYAHTPWAMRDKKMIEEKNKFINRYKKIDIQNDLIKIKMPIDVSLKILNEGTNEQSYILLLTPSGANKIDYFPYKFLDQYIAVIPTNFTKYKKHKITKREFEKLKPIINKFRGNSFNSIIELQATTSDTNKPYNLDGINQWLLKAQIVSFSIIDNNNQTIWEKTEPWYTSPITKSLNSLYSGQYKKEPEYIEKK